MKPPVTCRQSGHFSLTLMLFAVGYLTLSLVDPNELVAREPAVRTTSDIGADNSKLANGGLDTAESNNERPLDETTLRQIHYASVLFDRADGLRKSEKNLHYARELAERVARIVLDIYGPGALEYARCLNLRASIEIALREFASADLLLNQAKNIFDKWGPDEGWQQVSDSITFHSALTSQELKKYSVAESLYVELLKKYQAHEIPVECGIFNIFLGSLYLETDQIEKATQCIELGYGLISDALPENDQRRILASVALGRLQYAKGEYDAAEKRFVAAMKLEQERKDEFTIGYSDIAVYLGDVYKTQQKHELAFKQFELALSIRRRRLGDDHTLVKDTRTILQAVQVPTADPRKTIAPEPSSSR